MLEGIQIFKPSLYSARFAGTAEGIFYIAEEDSDGRFPIQFFSFAAESIRPVTKISGGGDRVSVTPDGRWLLYVENRVQADLMLVENFR